VSSPLLDPPAAAVEPRQQEWICSICLYVPPVRALLDPESAWELDALTIQGGHLVCVRHACLIGSDHRVVMRAVQMESDGAVGRLSDYGQWRRAAEVDGGDQT
jgi:hypothetical protein